MNIIDSTYFNRLALIVNVNEPEPNKRTALDLNELIGECEHEVLSNAFGWKMWKDFKEKFDSSTLTPEYQTILDGKIYTKDDKEYYFKGLVDKVNKTSLLADFVFYQYQDFISTQQTEFGQVSIDVKVGNKANPTPKMVKYWNSFIKQFYGERLLNVSGYTPEGNPFWILPKGGIDYYGYQNNKGGEVSLLKFLKDNESDYPLLDINPICYQLVALKNSWGV